MVSSLKPEQRDSLLLGGRPGTQCLAIVNSEPEVNVAGGFPLRLFRCYRTSFWGRGISVIGPGRWNFGLPKFSCFE